MQSLLPKAESLVAFRYLWDLALVVLSVKLAGHLSTKLGQPAVLGKILAGIILGPSVLGLVELTPFLREVAEIGVLVLMFLAGLETDIKQFLRHAYASTLTAVGGVVLPFVGGILISLSFGYSVNSAVFIGTLLMATSVSISVQTLRELGSLQSKTGMVILGAAVLDDVIGIIALSLILGLAMGQSAGAGAGAFAALFTRIGVYFALAVLIGLFVIPRLLRAASKLRVSEPVVAVGLTLAFLYAYGAEAFGMAAIVGSYTAGLMMSLTGYHNEIFQKVDSIGYVVFVPVFLVSIGLRVDVSAISWSFLGFAVAVTSVAILAKVVGCGLGALAAGFSTLTSLGIGTGMIARGEVALMLATLGKERGLIDSRVFAASIVLVLTTTLVTPLLLKRAIELKRRKRQERLMAEGSGS